MKDQRLNLKKEIGITLVALVVTIVVLLILAGVSINTIFGENGIIKRAKKAQEQIEISNEKEIIMRAKALMTIKNEDSKISCKKLEEALQEEIGKNNVEASDAGETIDVFFSDTNRYYEINENGDIIGPNEVVNDENAGDITKGGRCDGSKEKPYEINCIEDLVVLSNMTNGKGIKFVNGKKVEITENRRFTNEYIILMRSLNFKSKYSYADSTRTDFGNINGDDTDGNALITEMTTGIGFEPIGRGGLVEGEKGIFDGNFDGQENTISNLWIKATESDNKPKGLFGCKMEGNISNVRVTGEIISNNFTGGIIGRIYSASKTISIDNCINKVNLIGYNMVGGIIGYMDSSSNVSNCKNYGKVKATGTEYGYSGTGGIVGTQRDGKISKCINYGKVEGYARVGGIIGTSKNIHITECENTGEIIVIDESGGYFVNGTGGIVGDHSGGILEITNSYNRGNITGKLCAGGIVGIISGHGWSTILNTNINNCYNIGRVNAEKYAGGIIGKQERVSAQNYICMNNVYNLGNINGKQLGDIMAGIYYSTKADIKTELNNVYYTIEPAIGTGILTSGEAIKKTELEIKDEKFVELLNLNIGEHLDWKKWKQGENGYPVLIQ